MTEYRYSAVGIRQTEASDWLVMFGASATEVNSWSGIPRKQQFEGHETTGFQRENDKGRISQIRAFFSNQHNVLQNPLLCASRVTPTGAVRFVPHAEPNSGVSVASGELIITADPLEERPLLDLLRLAKEQLEQRVPSLRTLEVSDELIRSIKESAEIPGGAASIDAGVEETESEPDDEETVEGAEEAVSESAEQSEPQAALLEETHIADFWGEIAARIKVLEEISSADSFDVIAGFSKDAMISYLRPVVLVDGQHRLLGALDLARQLANDEANAAEVERAIDEGAEPGEVRKELEARMARMLPISLLITSDPAEHVFQFVIVNQKAVQMGRALLGTIVSTTLSADEIARVQDRLSAAEIPIEQSRIVTALVRDPSSPFFQRVERGIETTDRSDLLGWNILASLVKMFRELKGGRPYHEKNDYAADWRARFLPNSPITDGWTQQENESVLDFWKAPDGPWREVFLTFWTKIRDVFGNTEDIAAHNYWGRPRSSNLFNKVSLTILASDFFRFLCERRQLLENAEQIETLVDEWLEGVNPSYFNRDWVLAGVKRDSNGIRAKWSKLWCEYRASPRRLPSPPEYRAPLKI
jgi:hypothetical protein